MTVLLPTVGVGEPIPWFSAATDANGNNFIAIDELAGRHAALFFFNSAANAAVSQALGELAQNLELFDGKRAIMVAVSGDRDDIEKSRFPGARSGQFFLLDQSAKASRQFGITQPTADGIAVQPFAFILSPALQVLDIVPLTEPNEFVTRIASALREHLSASAEPETAPVLIVPRIFDREFCASLIDLYQAAGGRELGAIERADGPSERFDPQFRKRLDHHITDEVVLRRCREMLSRRLLPMVYRAFQFKTTRIERYLVGCYDGASGGYFRPHRDNTQPIVAHRRFALSVILNDAFEGGELAFPEFGGRTYPVGPGDALVFSCALLHEVTPVTRGRRYAFISFLYDEASHKMREQFVRAEPGPSSRPPV
jgi:predicted 2-oxoglutarate/Fe(II)-dependent dioxygenase YbiX/peroxiredoxin